MTHLHKFLPEVWVHVMRAIMLSPSVNFAFWDVEVVKCTQRAITNGVPLGDRYSPPNEDALPYLGVKS
jgi:hypothetical protein